ncbi:hypothetical protein CEXT_371341 [Caerostris extrusa]|uniref:Uncharacterized protein n=1 Tax=Caerostris extrusa TaxID=172846 RepID=A0AAV4P5A4_CAEEX|nr:hypothetical protein CEXT_371341 [Caerostris extrusa]
MSSEDSSNWQRGVELSSSSATPPLLLPAPQEEVPFWLAESRSLSPGGPRGATSTTRAHHPLQTIVPVSSLPHWGAGTHDPRCKRRLSIRVTV